MLLTGICALVTGATSGLGRAMAQALANAGARVAITSRDGARAETTAAEIGHAAIGVELDVRDVVSVNRGVDEVYGVLKGLDLLVNNAGIGMRTVNPRFMTHPQPFYEVSPDGFRDVVETKVTGTFLVARAVVPRMLAAGSGRVSDHLDERADDGPAGLRPLRAVGSGRRGIGAGDGLRPARHASARQHPPSRGCDAKWHDPR